eukprot:119163-Pelagomonas_calceolata.AAC.5
MPVGGGPSGSLRLACLNPGHSLAPLRHFAAAKCMQAMCGSAEPDGATVWTVLESNAVQQYKLDNQ